MTSRLVLIALLGALALTVAGCASNRVPIRARGPSGGMQGSAWELVVSGPEVTRALAELPPGEHPAYMTRRDAALGATTPSWAPVASAGGARPSIAYQRSVYLRRSHDSFLFFTTPGFFTGPRVWPAQPPRWAEPSRTYGYPPTRYWEP